MNNTNIIHIHVHGEEKLDRLVQQNDIIYQILRSLMATVAEIQAQADKTLAAIASESDKDDAIILLVNANTKLITDLKKQLADAINSGDPVALQKLMDSLTTAETTSLANAQKVVDAVNANTTA